jgi:hypothetical protein
LLLSLNSNVFLKLKSIHQKLENTRCFTDIEIFTSGHTVD